MPQVRTYGDQQAVPRGIPDVERQPSRLNVTATDLGAGVGNALTQIGGDVYHKSQLIKRDEEQRQNEIRVQAAESALSDWELKTIYDPKTGALTKKGTAAFGLPDEVGASYDEATGNIRNTLANDTQKLAFDRATVNRKPTILSKINNHVYAQMEQVADSTYKAYIGNSRALAQQNADDPARVATEIDNQRVHTALEADRLGLDAETTKRLVDGVTSDTHAVVIDQLLATGNDKRAKAYFDQVHDEISGDSLPQIEKALTVGKVRGESQRQADAIIADSAKPGAEKNLQEQLEEARKIQDPEVRDAVEDRLRSNWTVKRQAEADQREDTLRTHIDSIDKIMLNSLNKIDATGALSKAISPSDWAQLSAGERNTLEQYAKRKQVGEIETDWQTFYTLMNLATNEISQEDFARTNLMEYRARLGNSEFKQLAELQISVRQKDHPKTTDLLSGESQQAQIVRDALLSIGIDPTAVDNPSAKGYDKASIDRAVNFRRSVRENVAALEARTKKKADNDQVQEIVDNLIVKGHVSMPGKLWGTNEEERYVFEAHPGETLVVTAADVPKAERAKIEASLKRNGMVYISDDTVLALYLQKLKALGVTGVKK